MEKEGEDSLNHMSFAVPFRKKDITEVCRNFKDAKQQGEDPFGYKGESTAIAVWGYVGVSLEAVKERL